MSEQRDDYRFVSTFFLRRLAAPWAGQIKPWRGIFDAFEYSFEEAEELLRSHRPSAIRRGLTVLLSGAMRLSRAHARVRGMRRQSNR